MTTHPLAPGPHVYGFTKHPTELGYDVAEMSGNHSGEYVKLADYEALRATVATLTARLDAVTGERDELQGEIDAYKEAESEWESLDKRSHDQQVQLAKLRAQVAEMRDARREQMELDCKAVCEYCEGECEVSSTAWNMPKKYKYAHWAIGDERQDFGWERCGAENIRVAFDAALAPGGGVGE